MRDWTNCFTTGAVGTPVVRGIALLLSAPRRTDWTSPLLRPARRRSTGQERAILDPNTLSASGIVALDWWYPSRRRPPARLRRLGRRYGAEHAPRPRRRAAASRSRRTASPTPARRASPGCRTPAASTTRAIRCPAACQPAKRCITATCSSTCSAGLELRCGGLWRGSRARGLAGRRAVPQRTLAVDRGPHGLGAQRRVLPRSSASRTALIPIHVGVEAFAHPFFAGDRLLVQTNADAPNWALFEVDPEHPERSNWRQVLPERADRVLDAVHPVAGRLVAHEMHNATSEVRIYDLDGTLRDRGPSAWTWHGDRYRRRVVRWSGHAGFHVVRPTVDRVSG